MKKRNLFIAVLATFLAVLAMSVSAETKVTMFAKDGRSIQIAPSAVEQYKAVGWYEGVVMWAPDERCKVVSPFNVEAEKAVGWSTTPVELKLTKVTEDYGFGNGVLVVYTTPEYHDYSYRKDINKVFISRSVTEIGSFSFENSSNISRVEIPDTVTTIESYAFDGTSIDRIGIPKNVKDLDVRVFDTHKLGSYSESYNKNMTVYCEAGSEAEAFAKKYNLKYVYATMIYSLDGRTMMVDDKEKTAYVSSGLWGETPIKRMWTEDGKVKSVPVGEIEEYKKNGWYENKADVQVTMYAKDGRTKQAFKGMVEAEKKVGWYLGVTMYAADGRSKVVSPFVVEAEKAVGWYDNKADVLVTMYAADGRKKEVFKGKVDAEKKVGWYLGVKMYAADGRSKMVSPFKVEAEKKVGWYEGVKMYAADGRSKSVSPFKVEAEKAVGWYAYPVTTILKAGGSKQVVEVDANAYKAYKSIIDKSFAGIMDDDDFYKMYTDKVHKNAKVEKTLYAYLFDITGDGKEELFLKEDTSVSSDANLDISTCDEWIRVFTYTENGVKRIGQTLTWAKNEGPSSYGGNSYSYYEPKGFIGSILSSVEFPNISNECLYYCLGNDGKQYLCDYIPKYNYEEHKIDFFAYNGSRLEKVCTLESNFVHSWYVNSWLKSSTGSYLYEVNGEKVTESVYRDYLKKYTGGGTFKLTNNDCSEVVNKLNSVAE